MKPSPDAFLALRAIITVLLLGCLPAASPAAGPQDSAAPEDDDVSAPAGRDPLERLNRLVHRGNQVVYSTVLRPVSRGYKRAVPAPVRRGLGHFFTNLRFPVRFAGALLQGKVRRAGAEAGKFAVNTTIGFGGFLEASDRFPALAAIPPEDIGQALGRAGIGAGPFLVLPILGPCSLRDFAGLAGDTALTPTHWSWLDHYDWHVRFSAQAADGVNGLPGLLAIQDELTAAALDPYVALREGYLAHRETEIKR